MNDTLGRVGFPLTVLPTTDSIADCAVGIRNSCNPLVFLPRVRYPLRRSMAVQLLSK
jgi:hypothetical protein